MDQLRCSATADEARLRELWITAFGDGGAYLDNFFHNYYSPERVLVLERDGEVQAMTAWYPSAFHNADGTSSACAYLYAVATEPRFRGQGLAGRLLAYCDEYLREAGFDGVTTVPANPKLHEFFAGNGFRECFVQGEREILREDLPADSGSKLISVTAEEYHAKRAELLAGTRYVALALDGIRYQQGASELSDGGLYRLEGQDTLLCLEGVDESTAVVKELLGDAEGRRAALGALGTVAPSKQFFAREPEGAWQFGMLKWLTDERTAEWDWNSTAYLGFAFD